MLQPHQKTALQKTSHDFQLSLVAFQKAQQLSVTRQRTVVEGVKLAVDDDVPLYAATFPSAWLTLSQGGAEQLRHEPRTATSAAAATVRYTRPRAHALRARTRQLSPQELHHQESLIQEREAEIREIESGIHELHEIFRDLGALVTEQGTMVGASPRLAAFRVRVANAP